MLNKNVDPANLFESINKEDKNIKFANEIEKEGILNCLAIKIIRAEKGKFETSVFRKQNSISEILYL